MKPQAVKAGKKKGTPSKVVPPKKSKKVEESEEESEEDSEGESEEEAPVSKKANNGKKATPAKKQEEEDSDSDEDEEDEPMPLAKKKASPKTKAAPVAEAEDSSEEEESDEEEPPKKAAKAVPAKEDDNDDDEDDSEEDDSEDEEKTTKRKADKVSKQPATKKQKVEKDDEDDDDDDDDEEEKKELVTLFVKPVSEEVTDKKLMKWFSKNGVECSAIRKNQKGFAYVDLEDPEDLDKALALSGEDFKGEELSIEKAKAPALKKDDNKAPAGGRGGDSDDSCVLFAKNLSWGVTKDALAELFPNAKDVRIPTRPEGGIKGFAFIEFNSAEEVEAAVKDKQGQDVDGRAIYLDFMGTKSKGSSGSGFTPNKVSAEKGKSKVLFVKNLSYNMDNDSLAEAFEGSSSARVVLNEEGRSKGFGFVEFESPDAASEAFDNMKGQELDGRQVFIDFAGERGAGGRGGGGRGGGGRGFGGGRGGYDRGGRGGGFRGGRGSFDRGGRGGGGFRGGRGGDRGGRGGRGNSGGYY